MNIKLTTISPVILSPRTEKALYKGVDFKEILEKERASLKTDNINMVYPFYSYDDRNLLSESPFLPAKKYYIPASSLKGALLGSKKDDMENRLRSKILFQDVRVDDLHIKLGNLYKFQYLYQESKKQSNNKKQEIIFKNPKFAPFFPGVAVEMMGNKEEFEFQVLLKEREISEEFFKQRLEENFDITKRKLKNYIEEIERRIKDISSWVETGKIKKQEENDQDYIAILKDIKSNIQMQIESNNIVFLGGYKGILGSISQLDKTNKIQNGFYLDQYTLLPYGLVKVSLE